MNIEQISSELMSNCFPMGWSQSLLLPGKQGNTCGSTFLPVLGFVGFLFLKSYFVVIWICGSMINNKVECVCTYTYSYILAIPISFSQLGLFMSAVYFLLFFFLIHWDPSYTLNNDSLWVVFHKYHLRLKLIFSLFKW